MISFFDTKQYINLDFIDYLNLPGYSTSFLKRQIGGSQSQIELTEKIKIGRIVDSIMTEPDRVNMSDPLYVQARDISYKIKEIFGDIIIGLQSQVSYTGKIEYSGVIMPTKGRLDWEIPKLAILDLKVTYSKNIENLIKFMQYEDQMFLYSGLASTIENPITNAFLLIYSVPLKKCIVHHIDCSSASQWWVDQILKFGQVNQ